MLLNLPPIMSCFYHEVTNCFSDSTNYEHSLFETENNSMFILEKISIKLDFQNCRTSENTKHKQLLSSEAKIRVIYDTNYQCVQRCQKTKF